MDNKYIKIGPVAGSIPFDPENCDGLTGEDIQTIIEQICAASSNSIGSNYQFGREGEHDAGFWLIGAEAMSNRRGLPFGLLNGKLKRAVVSTKNIPSIFTIEIFYHDGNLVGLTSITTITTTASDTTEVFSKDVSVPPGHQIAVKITAVGATKPIETGVFLELKGTTV